MEYIGIRVYDNMTSEFIQRSKMAAMHDTP